MSRKEERVRLLKTLFGFYRKSSWDHIKIYFVVSTGRTGTQFLERFFRLFSSQIDSRHEPNPVFLKLGMAYARGKISRKDAVRIIRRDRMWICDELNKTDKTIYIESNNRLFSLIPVLWDVFPHARIIHIIRDGRDYVRSEMNRDQYTKRDKIYAKKNLRLQATDFSDDPYYPTWKDMSPFERVCWHWCKKDSFIRRAIAGDARAITVKFEEMFDRSQNYEGLWKIIEFLKCGISRDVFDKKSQEFAARKYNVNKKNIFPHWQGWSDEQRRQFQKIAGGDMRAYGYDLSGFVSST